MARAGIDWSSGQDRTGPDGPPGESRPANGEGRRGAASFPAPVAAPVRTGLEPPDSAPGAGRTRKESPSLPAPSDTEDGVPDPLLLLRFLLFLGYRRIRPGNVLEHPARRDLAAAIASDPGLDLAGCIAVTGANRETLRYHLALLVCSGKVVEESRNGSVRYFPATPVLTPVHRAVLHFRRNPSLAPLLTISGTRRGAPGWSSPICSAWPGRRSPGRYSGSLTRASSSAAAAASRSGTG